MSDSFSCSVYNSDLDLDEILGTSFRNIFFEIISVQTLNALQFKPICMNVNEFFYRKMILNFFIRICGIVTNYDIEI